MRLRSTIWLGLIAAILFPVLMRAQATPGCTIAGLITANRIPLPGVVVSLLSGDHVVDVSSSGVDGAYAVRVPLPGGYTLKAELTAFAPATRDIMVDQASCAQRVDVSMMLASRAPAAAVAAPANPATATTEGTAATTPAPAVPQAAPNAGRSFGGRGQGGRGQGARGQAPGPQPFQSLELLADQAGLVNADDTNGGTGDSVTQGVLPPGFSPDTAAESVTAVGAASQQNNVFFGPNGPNNFAQRFGEFGDGIGGPGGAQGGGPGGFGGPGGGPGGRGGFGGGPVFGGPLGRGGRGNQIRGSVFSSEDTSALDSPPYPINGQTTKPHYLQQRFGANLGGPLSIPHVVDSARTFFFLNYTGNHSSNPYTAYSTVPTAAERGGDMSALGTVVDPATKQPFANNQIPQAMINPASLRLLSLFPLPNQPGLVNNFENVTTVSSQVDDINMRIVHTFGTLPQRGRGQGGARGQGGGRGGGRGGPQPGSSNLNVTIHYRRTDNTSANPFPTLGGSSSLTAWDIPANYSFTKGGMLQTLRFDFNRQQSQSQNLYANSQNIAGDAGLLGVSTDPFDWGAPNLSFSKFGSVRDVSPSTNTSQTISIGDTTTKIKNKHTFRFGGDLRRIEKDARNDANARGSYVFTGLYTGSDFGDFLLGLPQQASVQYGPNLDQFRQTWFDLFAQDDWRVSSKVTVNAGLRYEFFSPVSEVNNALATLAVGPNFTTVVPVQAGQTDPFAAGLPDTIVKPFYAGFSPRLGVAWRANDKTVLRAGYSINYNSSVYQTIAQQLATQPPFARIDTILAAAAAPQPLESILTAPPTGTNANTYAVNPDYRMPFVQMWNIDLQRDLTRTIQLGVGYTGTKGSDLDLLEAPNRTPTGLLIPTLGPFLYETSAATSIMNSLNVRIRKRLTGGLALSGSYTLTKALDDASSIAGVGGTVAQNPNDLTAERSLSSFDQLHQFTGTFTYELPFGEGKPWLNGGKGATLLGHWILNGTVQLASGTPYTAYVLGAATDVAAGVNGTLRANYNGQPIAIANPTLTQFFNTAAFSQPAPGTYGDAGRNTIVGPGTSQLNFSVMRNLTFGGNRVLSVQVVANNVLNTVQFATIDTNLNSPTFGHVLSARPMRTIQIVTRFRF